MVGTAAVEATERTALLTSQIPHNTAGHDHQRPFHSSITDPSKPTSPAVEEVSSTPPAAIEDEDSAAAPASTTVIWTVFPVLLAGIFLSNVVSSVVLATNQHIASEFSALSSAAWLLTTYTLAQSASQPLYGKLSDIFGRRRCLVFCWLVFGVGCLLSGLGTRYWHVILGRAVSGVGSAGKIALTSVVVADIVPLRKVAAYRAYVNLTATTARSLGGPIGGWLAGSVGWRWPFVVQFPLAVLGLLLVLWKLPEPNNKGGAAHMAHMAEGEKTSGFARIDFAGAGSLIMTIVSGMLALDLGTKGYRAYISISMTGVFVLFLACFIVIEKRHANEPILPLSLVARRDVLAAYLIISLQSAGQFGLLYSIPIYFQVAMGESVSQASTRIVPVVVGNALGTILSGRLISRVKRYKALTAFANCAGFAGFTLLLLRWHGHTNSAEALYVVLPGVGMGIVQSSSFVHLAATVSHEEIAIAGTAWFLAQNIGVLVGASLSTALINGVLRVGLRTGLAGEEDKAEIIRRVTSNVGHIRTLPHDLKALVTKAYVTSLLSSDALSMIFIFLALLVTITVREKPL